MKRFLLAAALIATAAPASAEVYSHSFPGIGPTGTYCTTIVRGSTGSTSCSRGLTDAEAKADKAQWEAKTTSAAKAQGLPANYCQLQAAKAKAVRLAAAKQVWAGDETMIRIVSGRSDGFGDLLLCQNAIQQGKEWHPFFMYPEAEALWAANNTTR